MLDERSYNRLAIDTEATERAFLARVYAWMMGALILTMMAAWATIESSFLMVMVENPALRIGLVIAMTALLGRISLPLLSAGFVLYSLLNGVTLSVIFLVYTEGSIVTTFGVTAATFGIMSLYGYTTGRDLTGWGNLLFMGLVGIILASLVNLFLQSEAVYWVTTYIGVIVFVGLIAYDTQKLKRLARSGAAEGEFGQKLAITGALSLYLDFINLFLKLLAILGKRR
jgi:FtsH-binding integral membrane protein